MTFSITTLSTITFSITTLSTKGLFVTLSLNDIQNKGQVQHYKKAIMLSVVILSVTFLIVMLNVIMLNVIMLNVIMLNVVMLCVVMLNVAAPNMYVRDQHSSLFHHKPMEKKCFIHDWHQLIKDLVRK
jgi:hypothetical protein